MKAVGLPIAQAGMQPQTEPLSKEEAQEEEIRRLRQELQHLQRQRERRRAGSAKSSDSVSTSGSQLSNGSWRHDPYGGSEPDINSNSFNSTPSSTFSSSAGSRKDVYGHISPHATRSRAMTGSTIESEHAPPTLLSSCSEYPGHDPPNFTPGSSLLSLTLEASSGGGASSEPAHPLQASPGTQPQPPLNAQPAKTAHVDAAAAAQQQQQQPPPQPQQQQPPPQPVPPPTSTTPPPGSVSPVPVAQQHGMDTQALDLQLQAKETELERYRQLVAQAQSSVTTITTGTAGALHQPPLQPDAAAGAAASSFTPLTSVHSMQQQQQQQQQVVHGSNNGSGPTGPAGIQQPGYNNTVYMGQVQSFTLRLTVPTEPLGFEYGSLSNPPALVITSVDPQRAASRSGISAGCLIQTVNGHRVYKEADLLDVVRQIREMGLLAFTMDVLQKPNAYKHGGGFQQPQQRLPQQRQAAPPALHGHLKPTGSDQGLDPQRPMNIRLAVLFKHGRRGEFMFDQV